MSKGKLVRPHCYFIRLQAQLMASNQTPENENPMGREEPVIEILNPEQLAQENQALKTKMEAMEAQMADVLNMMRHLRNGAAAGAAAIVNSEGVGTFVSAEVMTVSRPEVSHSAQIHPWGMPRTFAPSIVDAIPTSQPAVVTSNGPVSVPHIHIPSPSVVPLRSPSAPAPELVMNPPSAAYQVGNPAQYGGYYFCSGSYPQGQMVESSQPRDRYHLLEERLRAMEGSSTKAKDARDLCLVPGVVIPPKFKAPDFDKYRGTGCPSSHLTMYVRKMAAYAHDDKVLIYFFQNSLTGASLDWYMQLQSSDIHSWKDLSEAFLKQYHYNMDLAPDRSQLQHMSKGDKESLKEYAQKWRSIAAQVKPPLTEKEMVYMFMETLPGIYYERLVSSVSSNFSDMVIIGERLEHGLRSGKIAGSFGNSGGQKKPFSNFPKKKEGETNAITAGGGPSFNSSRQAVPLSFNSPQQANSGYRAQNYQERRRVSFDPIPMTYTDLFKHLISKNLIKIRPMKPMQPPFPKGYNAEATCSFHSGGVSHTVEDCKAFKYVVQDLIDANWISFKPNSPSTTTNPLPGHGMPSANAIEDSGSQIMIKKVESIKTHLEDIYAELCRLGVIQKSCVCADPVCAGVCEDFKSVLQDLMDRYVVRIEVVEKEESVLMLQFNDGKGARNQIVTEDPVPFSCEKGINEEVAAMPVKEGCWDTLGEPSGKFDYLVSYDVPESAQIQMEDIQPTGWDEEEEQHDQVAVINDVSESEEGGTSLVRYCSAG